MLHSRVSPYIMDWFLDKSEERHFDTAVDVAVGSALHFVADARRYSQSKTFEFGLWGLGLSVDAVQRLESEYGWPEWAAVPVGTLGAIASFTPLFAATVMPYTNPYTAPVAFAIDAYNIYRYFD